MTICVASIGLDSIILGASDRMLIAGDVQFEPPQTKIWQLTNSIALMVAGDISIHSEVYQETRRIVVDLIKKEPSNWLKVKDVAEIYSSAYHNLRFKRAEKEILWPLGLDKDTFIQRQSEMLPTLVNNLSTQLSEYKLINRDIGAIIAGNDGDSQNVRPHIYVIENGNIECNDDIGFAAIGAGYWHANSQFMFNGYTKFANAQQQLLNTYWAKKRAEVAPGVGKETDMFVIGPILGSFQRIPENIIRDIDTIYKTQHRKVNIIEKKSEMRVKEYLDQFSPPSSKQQNSSENSKENNSPKPPDGGKIDE